MAVGLTGIRAVVAILALVAGFEGVARAGDEGSSRAAEIPILESRVEAHDAMLEARIREVTAVGADVEGIQARVDAARVRTRELGTQTRRLERELRVQQETFRAAKTGYEERVRAAYKGGDVEGLTFLLDGLLGSTLSIAGLGDPRVAEILYDGRQSLDYYRHTQLVLRDTSRQISQKRQDYEAALQEERARGEELRRHERELEASIEQISSRKARTEARLQELRAAERARILRERAATGGGEGQRGYELGIARKQIVASSVPPISRGGYLKLYRESARRYGFGEDWYILAAVGKVESNHGESTGPSTAGAMGPMQFLPSTWETAGVDGNGDGVANIMDPRDAIPAAARYLQYGGAPRDWYRALFTYNHADWYVMKVLAVAEAYRRIAEDNTVGPYI